MCRTFTGPKGVIIVLSPHLPGHKWKLLVPWVILLWIDCAGNHWRKKRFSFWKNEMWLRESWDFERRILLTEVKCEIMGSCRKSRNHIRMYYLWLNGSNREMLSGGKSNNMLACVKKYPDGAYKNHKISNYKIKYNAIFSIRNQCSKDVSRLLSIVHYGVTSKHIIKFGRAK